MSDTRSIPKEADVVVIGAGIHGTATAYYLTHRNMNVVVCEKGRIAGEQSSRNWGFVRQQGRDPAEIPLMMEANGIWRGLERELNADLEWTVGGNMVVFRTGEERAMFERWMEHAKGAGLDSRIIDRSEVERIVPGTTLGELGAIYTASDGHAEPAKATPALARAAEGRGATFLENCAVFRVLTEGGHVSGVMTEHGEIRAPVVVLATGAWSSKMLSHLGLKFPQVWIKGSVGRTEPVAPISESAVWGGVAFRQRQDGSINFAVRSSDADLMMQTVLHGRHFFGVGKQHMRDFRIRFRRILFDTAMGHFSERALARELTRYRTLDPEPNHAVLAAALTDLKRAIPAVGEAATAKSWAGYIDMTPDLLPVIEAQENPRGLILATGFSGHGFGMGPIVGKLVAQIIAVGQPSLDLSAFRFSRFHDGTDLTAGTAV
ncbi:MAG: NAD(P)/FAD-dependent oxidoreductase [Minwuia sp.]|uniref:NAD(P)/FAD-dependent oxidoreductase n=1 Tax=Minwuia sp. TaxID=2493630 RepID=UPI003A8997ED